MNLLTILEYNDLTNKHKKVRTFEQSLMIAVSIWHKIFGILIIFKAF